LFTSLPDSPQGVGDIVGLACRLVRGNIKLIFHFLLVPTIFATVAGVAFQWVITYGINNVTETKNVAAAFSLAAVWIVGLAVFAIAWWILGLRLLALTRLALGFSETLEDAKQNLMRKKWSVLGVYFLCLMLLSAGVVAFVLIAVAGVVIGGTTPSLVSALGFVISFFGIVVVSSIYLLVSHIALCIMACEDTGVVNVIGRSIELTFRHFWRAIAFGSVFALTFTVISYPMSLPVAILTLVDWLQHGMQSGVPASDYKPPLYILVIAQTWESVMGMYLRPLVVLAFGLFYYDMRLRSEGLDISRRLALQYTEPALGAER
jgi:hypothetical protein